MSYPTNPTRGHATGIIERNTFHLRNAASSSSNLEAGVTKALISGPLPLLELVLVLVLELELPLLLLPMPLLLLAIAIVARLGLGRWKGTKPFTRKSQRLRKDSRTLRGINPWVKKGRSAGGGYRIYRISGYWIYPNYQEPRTKNQRQCYDMIHIWIPPPFYLLFWWNLKLTCNK